MVEPNNNPPSHVPSPSHKPWAIYVIVAAILGLGIWAAVEHSGSHKEISQSVQAQPTNAVSAPTLPPVLLTNKEALAAFDARWSGVVGFLNQMKEWGDTHPVCHMSFTTEGMGGKTYADTDMYRFFGTGPDSTNLITRATVHLRYPNPVTFVVEQVGEEMIMYLPETDQLVKVDPKSEIKKQLGWDLQEPNAVTFLNLLRVAFVETNGTQRALTFAFKPEAMNTPAAASIDTFTTMRIDKDGMLQTVEVTEGGEHRIVHVKYLSFMQDEVSRSAPQIPPDKPVVVGKALNLALQEEIIKLREKGTRI